MVLAVTIGSFAGAALLGIVALLVPGEFSQTQFNILLTTLVVGAASLAMLCYLAVGESAYRWVGLVGGVVALVPTVLLLGLIWGWGPTEGETMLKALAIGGLWAVTLAQASLLLAVAAGIRRLRYLLWATLVLAAVVGLIVSVSIAFGLESDPGARLVGVLAILDVLGTLVTIGLAKFGRPGEEERPVPAGAVAVDPALLAALDTRRAGTGETREEAVATAIRAWLAERDNSRSPTSLG